MGQQSLIYSFVARGTVVLAEFTGNFTSISCSETQESRKQELEKLMQDQETLRNSRCNGAMQLWGGCGKSTLLEILAGRIEETKNSKLQGVVMYNDKDASEIHLSRLIAYISGQLNKHLPFLSVRETLEFARDCTQGLRPENFTPQMRKFFAHALVEGQDPFLEYVLEILSLKDVEHKLTGEAISDIDRQKLTTAELALGTYSVMLYDQPFSGSDLAATYDLVDTIRTISRIQQSSAIMSLTQISQEVFDLFDRIILLGDGHVLFQGPRQDAIPYFANLGYKKPSHAETAEFLEDIAAGHGLQYMAPLTTTLSIDELVEYYKASDHYKDIARIAYGDDVKLTYWVDSEPGLGLAYTLYFLSKV
ncbi:ABC transporter G family member 31 [Camellia lanceoleosa]|uniref:ABC transporter G family member 31 n=1 Tax=Camellia lanceoleosa TaxID=1840588 RepID=A0ACC0G8T9_9ERIC|nr:ABC transporter G family member 31 [Camellia lanceoleosa]